MAACPARRARAPFGNARRQSARWGDTTAAHQGTGLAELVCSNSFRSDDHEKNAVGLLHEEMRRCDSLLMAAAETARVPAGSALAVDRDVFSAVVEQALAALPNLEIVRERVDVLPAQGPVIVATGPLTAPALAEASAAPPGPTRSPSSMPLPPSSTATASTWTCAGWRAGGTGARPRTTSTAL
jgi:hypothetical protein